MTRNFEATSARGVVSSKRCFSNVQYTAAAKTLVGVRSSNLSNAECDGSGKMAILQSCISSLRSDVLDVLGVGGGARRGETWPGGKTSWRFGCTAAASIIVKCSGDTRFATSAKFFAAAA